MEGDREVFLRAAIRIAVLFVGLRATRWKSSNIVDL